MGKTPDWIAKRPRPKEPGKRPPQTMLDRRTSFGDFSEGSGRTQCAAIARTTTGARCRHDAIGGQRFCKQHGGINGALATARAQGKKLVLKSDRGMVRAMRFREKLLGS